MSNTVNAITADPSQLSTISKLRRLMQDLNTALELVNDEDSFQDVDTHYLSMLDRDLRQCRNDLVDIGNVIREPITSEYISRNPRFS